jgi:hypothetical protein
MCLYYCSSLVEARSESLERRSESLERTSRTKLSSNVRTTIEHERSESETILTMRGRSR